MIDHLMGVAAAHVALDHAGQHDQGYTPLRGVGDAVDRVGEARAERRHQNAGRRHHRTDTPAAIRAAGRLVPGKMKGDAGPLQSIDQRDHLPPGMPKAWRTPCAASTAATVSATRFKRKPLSGPARPRLAKA